MLIFDGDQGLKRSQFELQRFEPAANNRVLILANDGHAAIVLERSDCIAIAKAAGWPTPRQDKRR